MKLPRLTLSRLRRAAFSLPELLVAASVFSMVAIGTATITMYGMRQDELTRSKLGINNQARKGINQMLTDIRVARDVQFGDGSSNYFTEVSTGSPQMGKAIQVFLSTNQAKVVRYYLDVPRQELRRYSSENGRLSVVAQYLTNQVIFRAEDYTGTNILTVSPDSVTFNYVVGITLDFYQFLYPRTIVNTNSHYNYYRLRFKATRHAP